VPVRLRADACRPSRLALACLAALALPAAPAAAQEGDRVSAFVEERIAHDDNVFRLSSQADLATAIGSPSRADTLFTTSAGLNLDLPVSRQRLVGALTLSHTHYQRFSRLDFDGHDLRTAWLWQAGDRARGELGYSDVETLASFANVAGSVPDRLGLRQAWANGALMLGPYWRLKGGASRLEQSNSDPARRANDAEITGASAGLDFVSRAGNSLGAGVRAEEGRFPHAQLVGATLVDNAYQQAAAGLSAEWSSGGATRLRARAEQLARRYEQLPQRDFDGMVARGEAEWRPGAKLSLALVAQRDLSPYEYFRSSLVLVEGVALRPALRLSEKLELSASLDYARRDYRGDPAQALGLAGARIEHVRGASAQLAWRPARSLALQLSALHEQRKANVPLGDYVVNVVAVSGRFTF